MFSNSRYMYSASTVTASWLKRSNRTLMDNNALFSQLDKAMTKKNQITAFAETDGYFTDGMIGKKFFSTNTSTTKNAMKKDDFSRCFSGHDGICFTSDLSKISKGIKVSPAVSVNQNENLSITSAFLESDSGNDASQLDNLASLSNRAAYLQAQRINTSIKNGTSSKKDMTKIEFRGFDSIAFPVASAATSEVSGTVEKVAQESVSEESVDFNLLSVFNPVQTTPAGKVRVPEVAETNILNKQWIGMGAKKKASRTSASVMPTQTIQEVRAKTAVGR